MTDTGPPADNQRPHKAQLGFAARLLRNPLSVASAALASFLVVLALLTARMSSGRDPALLAAGPMVVHTSPGGHAVVRTTASGRVLAGQAGGAGEAPGTHRSAVVSRSSGAFGGGEHDD